MNLTPGLYTLSRDVQNPTPDRRQKHDWRALVTWEKGTEFYVGHYRFDEDRTCLSITLSYDQFRNIHEVLEHQDRFKLLAEALEPADMTPERRLHALFLRENYGERVAYSILERLVCDGVITIEQIDALMKKLEEEWNEES